MGSPAWEGWNLNTSSKADSYFYTITVSEIAFFFCRGAMEDGASVHLLAFILFPMSNNLFAYSLRSCQRQIPIHGGARFIHLLMKHHMNHTS